MNIVALLEGLVIENKMSSGLKSTAHLIFMYLTFKFVLWYGTMYVYETHIVSA